MATFPAPLPAALPFWAAFLLVPVVLFAAATGGWTLALPPLAAWTLFMLLDAVAGRDDGSPDPETPAARLVWHVRVTRAWVPVQIAVLLWLLATVPGADHLAPWEKAAAFFGMGILSGTVGIVFAHELMHRPGRGDRLRADVLLASVLYGHFRTEHLLVHHRHVGTPRDAVTARYNEGFHRFFLRVLPACLRSAWTTEAARLAAKGQPWWDAANPFWRYVGLQGLFLLVALALGGWAGLALFGWQALVAVWQLELVNYVEHYGLTRKHLGGGHYEPVAPRHSWNATHRASNRLLINLQRHADHHARPDRPFPLLQTWGAAEAPQLPHGYPVMAMAAMVPPVWRRIMNPRVRAWRRQFYPGITDWTHDTDPRLMPAD
jgi:alkane 1-monooxygenase